jgi:Glycosyl transferases group 1
VPGFDLYREPDDNQSLGLGLWILLRHRGGVNRWYAGGFLDMRERVARGIPDLLTVSPSSATDITMDFGVNPHQPRIRGRIIAIAGAVRALKGVGHLLQGKGVGHLLQAVAKLQTEHGLELQLVAKLEPNGPTEKLIAELGISDIVHTPSGLSDAELARLFASSEIACTPSLYEGFPLPAVEPTERSTA